MSGPDLDCVVLYSFCLKQLERDLTFISSLHTLSNNDRDASMIVVPKILAMMTGPSTTPIETPMHGSDRSLLTIAKQINGKSSRQQ
jgi:hypothetical protein